jgi:hypothetical protein
MSRRVACIVGGAVALAVVPVAAPIVSANNDDQFQKAGLVTLCSTDNFVRVGGLNSSNRDVTISLTETGADGKAVSIVGSNASDELKAIFPITIPANSKYLVTWDLPFPAHYNGVAKGPEHQLHGSWNPARWVDENGLNYRGTGGTAGKNGGKCEPSSTTTSTTSTTTIPETTTTSTTTTSTSTTTSTTTSSTVAPDVLEQLKPVGVFTTSNSHLGALAFDGDLATAFETQMIPGQFATWAWVRADLGKFVDLRTIEFELAAQSAADDMKIQVSTDLATWTTIAVPGEAAPGATQIVETGGVTARWVRFYWRNPNDDEQLGHLAEARFFAVASAEPQVALPTFGAPVAPAVMPPAPQVIATSASPLGERIVVTTSSRSSNAVAGSSRLPLDGDTATAFSTQMSVAPWTGWARYDLGDITSIGRIRFQFNELGMADYYRIQVSNDGASWTSLATYGNATKADEWNTLLTDVDARYVRFFFINVNADANVGGLSEVRFYTS